MDLEPNSPASEPPETPRWVWILAGVLAAGLMAVVTLHLTGNMRMGH
ncbi:MAG: hypothetical protein AABX89_07515 [Candidatus Thermoplasmatota archaeon]